ncbi:hypothetical protein D6C85_02273 [Aureobasidium pullulans]|uniref:Uncharacterized protein n=1 Tax=Aureobasidium pullulans TaxID=5580 RepID=A0A4S9XD87_AURPU|nr:hypothetical protein D6C85_02273 [Aureobasidium pullulans]TIA03814.1 hypothetical protein D6C82_01504 [Aureobasidium pullulans]
MTYSRYAPYGRVYRPANQWPEGSLEKRLATQMATQLNNGAACLLMYKYPGTTYFDDIRDWDGDASYRIVTPSRSNPGSDTEFSVTGQAKPSPESSAVLKPTQEEIEGIYDKKLVRRFADGELFTIPEAEETGAIPVIDIQDPNHYFYYVPAFFERLTNDERFFQSTPTFIAMNKGEMPSFVFWQRSDKWQRYQHKSTDPVVDAELPEPNPATPRSASKSPGKQAATPRKDSMSPEAKANTQDDRAVRSRAPSPQERSSALAVNTEAAAQVSKKPEAEAELQWEIFDPRLEEDPIEFLDFYNTRLNGWHANRSRMMLREADIERVNYISPCLAHNHKEVVKNTTAETATASAPATAPAIAPSPTAMDIDSTTDTAPKPPSKLWVQPAPIAHDDPHWLGFLRKQKQRRDVRKSRLRPKSVFTSEHCNIPGVTKGDGKKAFLSREMYNNYYRRACKAQRLNEGLSKCCVACGLKWTSCTESRQEHYNRHRHERLLYYKNIKNVPIHIEPVIRAESLDPSKVTFVRHVPDLNWFRELEKVTLDNENELLQREHICRVCDKVIDLTDEDPAVHYYGHQCERDGLRKWQDNEVQNPLSPVIVTTVEGSFQVPTQSPPARSHKGFSPNADFMRRHDEITKAQAAALSGNLSAAAKAIQRTGTVTSSVEPVGSLATVQSKRVENKTQQGETEPLQANTHAQKVTDYLNERSVHAKKADIPLLPKPPAKSPANDSMEVDFIYEDSEVAQSPQEEVDDMVVASTEAVDEQVNLDAQEISDEILREAPMMPTVLISDVIGLVSEMVEECLKAPDELDIGGLSHKDYIKQGIFGYIEKELAKKSSSTTSASFKSAPSQQAGSTPAYVPKTPAPTSASVPKASPPTKVPEIATEDTDAVEDEDSMSDSWDESLVPVKNDGLDITPNEIDMQEILDHALNSGCSEKSVVLANADSEDVCRDLVDEYRASGKKPTPSVKRSIIAKVQAHLKEAIAHELIRQCAKNETETEAEAEVEVEADAEADVDADAVVEAEAEPSSGPDDIDSKPISQTRGDCLDFLFGDLGVSEALEQAAFEEGAGLAFFEATVHRAAELCYDMVEEARESSSKDKPAVVRRSIIKEVQNFVKAEIEKVSSSSELGSKWSTEAVASSAPVVSPQSASAPTFENYGRILRGSDPALYSLWNEAYEWGCGPNNLAAYRSEALDVVKNLITASRKSGIPLSSEDKESARQKALALFKLRISTEKDWRTASGQRLYSSREIPLQPASAPASNGLDMSYGDPDIKSLFDEATEWGCEMTTLVELASEALDTGHEMIKAIRSTGGTLTPKLKEAIQEEVVQHLESAIEKEKRLRLTKESDAASTKTLKRKRATTLPITPVSNRKTKSTRDAEATFHPDTPAPFVSDEVSPRLRKVSRKSADPLAKKTEAKKSKTVRYEPQVVISKKTTPKSIISKKSSTKTVPKPTTKKAAASACSSEPRPKRKAAVEAEKSFGKTKIVD